MSEPLTIGASAATASLSAVTLAFLGVEYFSLLGASVGTLLAVAWATTVQTRRRLALESILSTYIGALIGTTLYTISKGLVPAIGLGGTALLVLASVVGALYFKQFLHSAGRRFLSEIAKRDGPQQPEGGK